MMEFAGVKPEQLGRVKVTSVSERFLAEKEWQTVTRRGAVLACVGVPTVRKIEVELLMRAKNSAAQGDLHLCGLSAISPV